MLNLSRQEQALTQGQSLGQQVVARAVQIDELTVQSGAPAASEGSTAPVDAQAVAQRVLELMRQDLRVEHERRGRRR